MAYVDGYVLAVPTANKQAYIELAKVGAVVFKEHGALSVVENWGDDVPQGELTSLPMAVQCKADETVVFSWVKWRSREARDTDIEKAMADQRMQPWAGKMPFDGKRMIFGGFETIIDA